MFKDLLKRQPEYGIAKKLDGYNGKVLPQELSNQIEEIRKASDVALAKLKAIGNDILIERARQELSALENWERDVGELEDAK